MKMKFCQSCGMPMVKPDDFGSEKNGIPSREYCCYCYGDGAFTQDISMEEMIRECAKYSDSFRDENGKNYTKEEAVAMMEEYFPRLKRWQV